MIAIILALLLLMLCIPVGVDLGYEDVFLLKLKIGFVRLSLLPGKKKNDRPPKEKKRRKEKDPTASGKKKNPLKLALSDLSEPARLVLSALGRLRRSLCVELLQIHVVVAAEDPYDAVMRYGALNALLGVLAGPAHNALKIRKEDVRTDVDVQGTQSLISLRLITTFRIWQLLWVALSTGYPFLRWRAGKLKAAKAEETIQEEKAS